MGWTHIEIPLTRGYVALIDIDDYEDISQFKWHAKEGGRERLHIYAKRNVARPHGGQTSEQMHRVILGVSDPAIFVDHINGDGLDNRRSNLRLANRSQNKINTAGPQSNNTSGYIGVYRHTETKWLASIGYYSDGRRKREHIGLFDDLVEAARARDRRAEELFGEFARLNFPEGS